MGICLVYQTFFSYAVNAFTHPLNRRKFASIRTPSRVESIGSGCFLSVRSSLTAFVCDTLDRQILAVLQRFTCFECGASQRQTLASDLASSVPVVRCSMLVSFSRLVMASHTGQNAFSLLAALTIDAWSFFVFSLRPSAFRIALAFYGVPLSHSRDFATKPTAFRYPDLPVCR